MHARSDTWTSALCARAHIVYLQFCDTTFLCRRPQAALPPKKWRKNSAGVVTERVQSLSTYLQTVEAAAHSAVALSACARRRLYCAACHERCSPESVRQNLPRPFAISPPVLFRHSAKAYRVLCILPNVW